MQDDAPDFKPPHRDDTWVLFSKQSSGLKRNLSALAILETLIASVLGILLFYNGYYWALLTAVMLTPFVHLRSPSSTSLGLKIFNQYWDRGRSIDTAVWPVVCITLFCILGYYLLGSRHFSPIAASSFEVFEVSYWSVLLGLLPGALPAILSVFWRGYANALSKPVAWSSLFLSASIIALQTLQGTQLQVSMITNFGSVIISIVLISQPLASRNWPRAASAAAFIVVLPLSLLGVFLRTLGIRFWATLKCLLQGWYHFPDNWLILLTKTDLTSTVEILPGAQAGHPLNFDTTTQRMRAGNTPLVRLSAYAFIALFVPSVFYRILLKMSFPFYLPIVWIAVRPDVVETGNWNDKFGRGPLDYLFFAISVGTFAHTAFHFWDIDQYIEATSWARINDAPNFWPLLLAGLRSDGGSTWVLLPGLTAALSLAIYFWSLHVSYRLHHANIQPKTWQLWLIVKLHYLKSLLTWMMIFLGFWTLYAYLSETCQMPIYLEALSSEDCSAPSGTASFQTDLGSPFNQVRSDELF